MSSSYLIALGSNRRHHLYGRPRDVLRAAMEELSALGTVTRRAPVIDSAPMGPAQRQFANGAIVLDSEYDPPALLAGLKRMERQFGRRKGRRWGDRVLDLDIVLWSGGEWQADDLLIPHVDFRVRDFVLSPAGAIAGDWRDPLSGLSIRQIAARV
ncbi:2-amino-4-hydroxy-6-hydroxymethyldihydropteridine diphosphokinase [Erythrobacter crassostreae]|uniref:2-amino-4-hydroxy-6-hydroxymethyldihydropteridine pyrophosphokinase n=1 Tax=Erythrobacter crassostreae TaxID=2828328 RepID=A0A9X1F449_9SPHN|nr:2-amino-4-hydroxy-6-hydroxymethyldihydropteridine diphosphokinase [Erythrobacter crassostrea]MBV7258978.1 2-amino-4-hydroxy-6-hydroxymethyldihydropteridine diphosphokinase [Erythrobacter crassostrea]